MQASTSDNQSDPVVNGLTNGNFLVVWSDDNATVAPDAGTDIVGAIFDALGNVVTGPLQLNATRSGDTETDPVIAALPNGGFILVYEDIDTNGTSIVYDRYDADGTLNAIDQGGIIFNDTGAPSVRDPSVAVASDGSFFVTYEYESGNADTIRGVKVSLARHYRERGHHQD